MQTDAPDTITWSGEMAEAFSSWKWALCSDPALGLSDYAQPFSALAQRHGGRLRPVAHLSKTLDAVVRVALLGTDVEMTFYLTSKIDP
uniref:Uncharacterized protein n=1 Tax=Electrophorus electricus TaxID=8005 RepID=A0AAY5EW21_ELEEL